ncbi:unnamed protein product [Phaedon cochleariae]|uniref:FAST kinase leucine-rich domain-containing protein n=1 Tax=Phaedon cochleariae TaxID=80249 RepID=A0A9N9X507_PHACE|nr:unnamed protein product [Phaedon cochleariae]
MSALSSKKRRSILLLRSLAYNITGSSELLNLKEAGDLLYSMSTLNFPDENLLSRIAADTCSELENAGSELEKIARKSSVVGSILTSLFLPQLTPSEAGKSSVWLEVVWSLVLLNKATDEHISSILDPMFLKQLEANQPSPDSGNSISSGKVFKGQRPINSMVAAVFDSLKGENSQIKTPQTDSKLVEATTVGELLTVTDGNGVSRRHALKVVSILADWSSTGKVKLSDFETDPRFLRLCRILSKQSSAVAKTSRNISHGEDLSTILNITAEDEAAKMVTGLTLSQMVKTETAILESRKSLLWLSFRRWIQP